MFITQAEVKARLAATLKLASPADLAPYWDQITADALAAGWADIQSVLFARGFSSAQINAWTAGRAYQSDQSLFWCLVNGAGIATENATYDDKFVKRLDRREELKNVPILDASGEPITPARSGVGHGELKSPLDRVKTSDGCWVPW
jgi:hypothetical protein